MTYVLGRQRGGFAVAPGWPGGFPRLAEAAAPFGGDSALQKWATDLATVWAGRVKSKPDERQREMEKKMAWLAKDYEVVLAGAQKRPGLKKYGSQAILRAWQVSREQQMDFETLERSPYLPRTFNPPAGPVQLVSAREVNGSDKNPVAPLVVAFMRKLLQLYPQARADTYPNHGGGLFRGRGFSIDLWLDVKPTPRDARGFWRPDDAVALLRAVHQAARAVGAEWRALYNDYSVARVINQETGARRVGFVGGAFPGGGLNWHGPHPLILHFHLDLAPLVGAGAPAPPSPLPPQSRASQSGDASQIAALPKILADAVKSGALTLMAAYRILAGERDVNRLTNLIFYARHPSLPVGYKIQPHEQGLAREWLEIRDKLVNPVLQRLKTTPVNNPKPGTVVPPPAKPTASAKLDRFRGLLPFLNRDRGDIPLDFLLGWIDVESGGNIGVVTQSLNERGYFQIYPDNSKVLRLDHERLSRDPEYSINSGIKLVRYLARHAQQYGFTYGTDLFWHIVKLLHWLPHGVQKILENMRKHNIDPTAITWDEFRRHVIRHQPEICQSMRSCKGGWNPLVGIANVDKVFDRGRQLAAGLSK